MESYRMHHSFHLDNGQLFSKMVALKLYLHQRSMTVPIAPNLYHFLSVCFSFFQPIWWACNDTSLQFPFLCLFLSVLHIFIHYLYFLFCEMPFLLRYLFTKELRNCVNSVDTNSLHLCVINIFSHSVAYLFIFIVTSFYIQKFFISMQKNLSAFLLIFSSCFVFHF